MKYTNDAYTLNDFITLTNAGVYTIQEEKQGYRISFYNPETRAIKQEIKTNPELATVVREVEPTAAYPSVIWKVEKVVKPAGQEGTTGSETVIPEDVSSPTTKPESSSTIIKLLKKKVTAIRHQFQILTKKIVALHHQIQKRLARVIGLGQKFQPRFLSQRIFNSKH